MIGLLWIAPVRQGCGVAAAAKSRTCTDRAVANKHWMGGGTMRRQFDD
jgi:hypothetical protein